MGIGRLMAACASGSAASTPSGGGSLWAKKERFLGGDLLAAERQQIVEEGLAGLRIGGAHGNEGGAAQYQCIIPRHDNADWRSRREPPIGI